MPRAILVDVSIALLLRVTRQKRTLRYRSSTHTRLKPLHKNDNLDGPIVSVDAFNAVFSQLPAQPIFRDRLATVLKWFKLRLRYLVVLFVHCNARTVSFCETWEKRILNTSIDLHLSSSPFQKITKTQTLNPVFGKFKNPRWKDVWSALLWSAHGLRRRLQQVVWTFRRRSIQVSNF